jgi:hypothetical protein
LGGGGVATCHPDPCTSPVVRSSSSSFSASSFSACSLFVSFVAVAVGSTFAVSIALCGGGFGLDCLLASLVFWV